VEAAYENRGGPRNRFLADCIVPKTGKFVQTGIFRSFSLEDSCKSADNEPPMANFTYSDDGLALTKTFEGLRLEAYPDCGGVWTIGYGHTGPGVHAGLTITEDQADTFLESDVACAVTAVNRLVTAQIQQHHFDALVDFTFNLGPAVLAKSTLLRDLNAGDFDAVPPQFLLWDHLRGVVVTGLLKRREAEAQLFTSA
jgi:lysozyme